METIAFIKDGFVETKKEWIEKISDDIISGIKDTDEERIAGLLEFSMDNDKPTFNEKSFIDFIAWYSDGLPDMLSGLNTKSGFSSTVKKMSFDEIVSLSNELAAHIGVKILCKLCDRAEK